MEGHKNEQNHSFDQPFGCLIECCTIARAENWRTDGWADPKGWQNSDDNENDAVDNLGSRDNTSVQLFHFSFSLLHSLVMILRTKWMILHACKGKSLNQSPISIARPDNVKIWRGRHNLEDNSRRDLAENSSAGIFNDHRPVSWFQSMEGTPTLLCNWLWERLLCPV